LALFFIRRFIKNNNIDIVHTHSSKAGFLGRLAARISGVKTIIHTVHGWSFHGYQAKPVYYLYLLLERFCASFSSAIIVVSQFDQRQAAQNLVGRPDQYRLIRYAVNPREFTDIIRVDQIKDGFDLSSNGLAVGMIACFKPQKAPLDFIKLASAIKNDFPGVKFILIGDGVLRGKVDALISKLDLKGRVILTGWRHDPAAILSCLDVFVLTSLWEGLPIAVLEAMAAGVPVLATDTGGIGEIVLDGVTGYLVKPHDIEAMGRRLRELLMQPSLRKELARSARGYAESGEYTLDIMLNKTTCLYLDLHFRGENA
jgi:glycosyltransferase involved in cell wall biosynthesis